MSSIQSTFHGRPDANVRPARRGWPRGLGLALGLLALTSIPAARAQALPRNAAAAGLWVGEVTLNQVTHVRGGTNAPTADTAQMRVLLHVATNGEVRLLKDVTLARRLGTNPDLVLVTNPALLPTLGGVLRRGGKLVGQRLATAAYDFSGNELLLDGGIGANFTCTGTLSLPADLATNPFRHKYHPDNATGLPITRVLTLRFTQPWATVNGVSQLIGDFQETVTGLHKTPITTKGVVTLNRISTTGVLN